MLTMSYVAAVLVGGLDRYPKTIFVLRHPRTFSTDPRRWPRRQWVFRCSGRRGNGGRPLFIDFDEGLVLIRHSLNGVVSAMGQCSADSIGLSRDVRQFGTAPQITTLLSGGYREVLEYVIHQVTSVDFGHFLIHFSDA